MVKKTDLMGRHWGGGEAEGENVRFLKQSIFQWWESQKERDHSEDRDLGGWTILKWIFER
jgi:hypothetical protein